MAGCDSPVLDANCPHRLLLDELTDKRSVLILSALDGGPARLTFDERGGDAGAAAARDA